MSNTQTTSRMDNQQDLLKDPEWWKKYKPGEWEDLEEDLALEGRYFEISGLFLIPKMNSASSFVTGRRLTKRPSRIPS